MNLTPKNPYDYMDPIALSSIVGMAFITHKQNGSCRRLAITLGSEIQPLPTPGERVQRRPTRENGRRGTASDETRSDGHFGANYELHLRLLRRPSLADDLPLVRSKGYGLIQIRMPARVVERGRSLRPGSDKQNNRHRADSHNRYFFHWRFSFSDEPGPLMRLSHNLSASDDRLVKSSNHALDKNPALALHNLLLSTGGEEANHPAGASASNPDRAQQAENEHHADFRSLPRASEAPEQRQGQKERGPSAAIRSTTQGNGCDPRHCINLARANDESGIRNANAKLRVGEEFLFANIQRVGLQGPSLGAAAAAKGSGVNNRLAARRAELAHKALTKEGVFISSPSPVQVASPAKYRVTPAPMTPKIQLQGLQGEPLDAKMGMPRSEASPAFKAAASVPTSFPRASGSKPLVRCGVEFLPLGLGSISAPAELHVLSRPDLFYLADLLQSPEGSKNRHQRVHSGATKIDPAAAGDFREQLCRTERASRMAQHGANRRCHAGRRSAQLAKFHLESTTLIGVNAERGGSRNPYLGGDAGGQLIALGGKRADAHQRIGQSPLCLLVKCRHGHYQQSKQQ